MTSSAIAASGLRKAYKDKVVLDGIDLDVAAGTVFSLLGPNGAGKTTTVNVLTTLVKADGGAVRVAGHDVRPRPRPYARPSGSPASLPLWTSC
jgi:ABC-2 type transport system ATP-binding protein